MITAARISIKVGDNIEIDLDSRDPVPSTFLQRYGMDTSKQDGLITLTTGVRVGGGSIEHTMVPTYLSNKNAFNLG